MKKFIILAMIMIILISPLGLSLWDTDWKYYKQVNVNNTMNSDGFDYYPVFINVTYDSDMKTNFDDIRFINTSSTAIELPYYVKEKVDSSWAMFVVNVSGVPSLDSREIYMYYGNADADNNEDLSSVAVWNDSFSADSLSEYQESSNIISTILNGLYNQILNTGGGDIGILEKLNVAIDGFNLLFSGKMHEEGVSTTPRMQGFVRSNYTGANDGSSYSIGIYNQTSGNDNIYIQLYNDGVWTEKHTCEFDPHSFPNDDWIDVDIKQNNTNLTVVATNSSNDIHICSMNNMTSINTTGSIGLGGRTTGSSIHNVSYDNVTLFYWVTTEPTVTFGDEETGVINGDNWNATLSADNYYELINNMYSINFTTDATVSDITSILEFDGTNYTLIETSGSGYFNFSTNITPFEIFTSENSPRDYRFLFNVTYTNATIDQTNSTPSSVFDKFSYKITSSSTDKTDYLNGEEIISTVGIEEISDIGNILLWGEINSTIYNATGSSSPYTITSYAPTTDANQSFIISTNATFSYGIYNRSVSETSTIYSNAWNVTNCTTGNVVIELLGYDEIDNTDQRNFSASLSADVWIGNSVKQYAFSWDGSDPNATGVNYNRTICMNPSGIPANINATIDYWHDETNDAPKRHYFYNDLSLNTSSITQTRLYLLNQSDALNPAYIEFTVLDSSGDEEEGIIIDVQKYFNDLGEYKTVAMGLTGPEGTSPIYLEKYNSWYKYLLKDGSVLKRYYGKEEISSTSRTLYLTDALLTDFWNYRNQYGWNCETNSTDVLICTVTDTTGGTTNAKLFVQRNSTLIWEDLCDKSGTGSPTVTLMCDLGNTSTNAYYYALSVVTPDSEDLLYSGYLQTNYINSYGTMGGYVSIMFILAMLFLGLYGKPSVAIFSGLLGMIGVWFIGFLPDVYTWGISVIVIGFILIVLMKD